MPTLFEILTICILPLIALFTSVRFHEYSHAMCIFIYSKGKYKDVKFKYKGLNGSTYSKYYTNLLSRKNKAIKLGKQKNIDKIFSEIKANAKAGFIGNILHILIFGIVCIVTYIKENLTTNYKISFYVTFVILIVCFAWSIQKSPDLFYFKNPDKFKYLPNNSSIPAYKEFTVWYLATVMITFCICIATENINLYSIFKYSKFKFL